MGQPSPLKWLACHHELLGYEHVLVRLSGLVEQDRSAVERAPSGQIGIR